MASLDTQRVRDIASAIRSACTPIVDADQATRDAKEVATGCGEAASGLRENILVTIAALSAADSWLLDEIKAATKAAAEMGNNKTEKALATFIGETRRAAHPLVRDHMPALVDLRNLAWDAETEQKKMDGDAPTPIRKAFSRRYHFLTAMLGEAGDGNLFTTMQEVDAFARSRDPDHDVDKVFKRLAKIRDDLAAFYADFPVGDIHVCVEALAEIDKKELAVARREKLRAGSDTDVVGETPKPAPSPSKLAAALTTTVADDDTSGNEMPDGASDILDDILGDSSTVALAAAA